MLTGGKWEKLKGICCKRKNEIPSMNRVVYIYVDDAAEVVFKCIEY
jgi:hypothetical protein